MHAHLGKHAGALERLGYQLGDRTLVIGRSRGGLMRPFRGRAASTRRAFPRRLRDPGLAGRMEGRGPFARKMDCAVVRASAPLRKARGLSLGAAREGGEELWESL